MATRALGQGVCSSSDIKQGSEPSQRFHFDSSEVKQCSEHSQRFHFSVIYAMETIFLILVSMERSKLSVISHL